MVKIEKSYFEGEKCQIALKTQNLCWFLQFHGALDDLRLNQQAAKFNFQVVDIDFQFRVKGATEINSVIEINSVFT